jgi:GTP-binding protein
MLPKIVIVGRPNVGKSSLLNQLAKRTISIVDPTAGVTRDRIAAPIEIPDPDKLAEPYIAEAVDTGGYGVEDVQNLTADIERQIAMGIAEAHVVLFVVDAQSGVVPLDRKVADVLRSHGLTKPVILVANKVDQERLEAQAYEVMQLGFGEPVLVSAQTRHGLSELYERIRQAVDFEALAASGQAETALPDQGVLLAIVGKRNAGKSTMVNALAGDQRVIVSEQEGTTRDSVDVRFEVQLNDGRMQVFTAIDTAGLRKRKSVKGDIEYYSMHRALRSVRRADVCVFVLDATVELSSVDRQLVNEVLRHHRPVVMVVNKWDLAKDKSSEEAYAEYLEKEMGQLNFAPIVFASAINAEGMRELLGIALSLYEQSRHRVQTSELNQAIETLMKERGPSAKGGRRAKIYYATQLDVNPPTLGLFVNHPDLFDNNYQRFLLNRLRDLLPFAEVPIKLLIRGKNRAPEAEG